MSQIVSLLNSQVYKAIFNEACPFFGHEVKNEAGGSIIVIQNPFTIDVKLLNEKRVHIDIGQDNTVDDLKTLIQARSDYPVDQQRLVYAGKQLEDGKTIADYNIIGGSVIHVVLRLTGC